MRGVLGFSVSVIAAPLCSLYGGLNHHVIHSSF